MTTVVSLWLFLTVLGVAVFLAICLFWKNPLPWPDRGHRCFPVADEQAAGYVIKAIGKRGLSEKFTFDAGPSRQTLLWDSMSVLIWYTKEFAEQGLPRGAFSVVTRSPLSRAHRAAIALEMGGFTNVQVHCDVVPAFGDKFVVVTSDEMTADNWMLLFRRHGIVLRKPPNIRKTFGRASLLIKLMRKIPD